MLRIKLLFALFAFAIGVCPAIGQKAQIAQMAQTLSTPQSQTNCKPGSVEQSSPRLYAALVAAPRPSGAAKAQVQLVCVPDFSRMTLAEAQQAIGRTKGLHFESATPNDPRGIVVSQEPQPGHYAVFGSGVRLTLRIPETKPEPKLTRVPDITKWREDRIAAELEGYHLRYGGTRLGQCNGMPEGSICQDPQPETEVEWEWTVNRIIVPAPPPPQPCSVPHTLSLTANATSLTINEDVRFTAELNPEEKAPRYQFFFDDKSGSSSSEEGGPIAWHRFAEDGTYTVKATAGIANCELAQGTLEVQVHSYSWTVLLEPDRSRTTAGKTITFHATPTPTPPEPQNPQYIFHIRGEKPYPPSSDSTMTLPFAKQGTYSVSVVMIDADKHKFGGKPVFVDVEPPPAPVDSTSLHSVWWYVAIGLAAATGLGGLGFAGTKAMQKLALQKLSVNVDQDKRALRAELHSTGSLVRDSLGFRLTTAPVYVESSHGTAILRKLERVEE